MSNKAEQRLHITLNQNKKPGTKRNEVPPNKRNDNMKKSIQPHQWMVFIILIITSFFLLIQPYISDKSVQHNTTLITIFLAGSLLTLLYNRVLEFSISNNGVQAKFEQLNDDLKTVSLIPILMISSSAYNNLKKLNNNNFHSYYLPPESDTGLALELNFLILLGFIEFNKNERIKGVIDLPSGHQPNLNLAHFISVTENGKKYIELREKATMKKRWF